MASLEGMSRTPNADPTVEPRLIRSYITFVDIYRELAHLVARVRVIQREMRSTVDRLEALADLAERELLSIERS